MSIGVRIAEARRAAGFSQKKLAETLGVGQSTVSQWESGTTQPSVEMFEQLAGLLKAEPAALAFGGSGRTVPTVRLKKPAPVQLGDDEFVPVPSYDIRAAAGAGAVNFDEQPQHFLLYRRDWLRSVSVSSIDDLAVLRVSGDSMQPTLQDGDTVLVDKSVRRVGRDGLYIIRSGDELQVKRVAAHPQTGTLTIKSDNPAYPTYEGIEPGAIAVLARVIWMARRV
jgi:phage repressor protein C with HTH and peptisase S24 domain